MPLHRQRLTQKKINRYISTGSQNYSRLPSIFMSMVAIVLVAGTTVWLINSNITNKPAPQVAAVRERKDGTIDVDANNAKIVEQIKNQDPNTQPKDSSSAQVETEVKTEKIDTSEQINTAETTTKTPAQENISTKPDIPEQKPLSRIPASSQENENINITELNCSFTYSKTAPKGSNPVTTSNTYWIPNTNCKNEELNFIQIISSSVKPKFENVQIENLDQDTAYALFYWKKDGYTKDVKLDQYLVSLTKFLADGKLYFNVKESFDKLQLNNKDTYYLSGNCDGTAKGACVLWGIPANGSLVSLLTEKGVANTATGQANNLTKGQYLKFAKTQDRNNRIALILKRNESKIDLIYLDPSKTYGIDEVRSYDKDTSGYIKYFR